MTFRRTRDNQRGLASANPAGGGRGRRADRDRPPLWGRCWQPCFGLCERRLPKASRRRNAGHSRLGCARPDVGLVHRAPLLVAIVSRLRKLWPGDFRPEPQALLLCGGQSRLLPRAARRQQARGARAGPCPQLTEEVRQTAMNAPGRMNPLPSTRQHGAERPRRVCMTRMTRPLSATARTVPRIGAGNWLKVARRYRDATDARPAKRCDLG